MELEEHQNSHTGQKPFQCDVCQSRFNRRSTLWNHKRIHSDAKPFICTVCHMQFKWKNSLKCHKEMHLRKNELQASSFPEVDATQMLTYATAAKKKMVGELTGKDPSTITLLPTTSNNSSRFLTCAGTPRKRAPPKTQKNITKIQKTFEEENILPPTSTTSSFSLPFLPQTSSTSSQNSNFSHQFFGKEIKNNENQINNSEQILENNLVGESSTSLLRPQPLTTTSLNNELIISNQIITENKQINTTSNAGLRPDCLDLFRLHCGLNQNNSTSEQQQQQLLLLQQQQQNNTQQFISPQHLQLISPTTTNNYSSSSSSNQQQQQQLIVQQNFPLDLLACCNNNGGGNTSILDFNLNNNNFDSTITQNNNLFGLDLNSIATNDSNNLISHINSSTGVIDQFNIQNQNSFCNTTAANSSVATTVLNNYPFDSASVRFLAAAAEISSSHQQQQKTNLNTDIQQQQQILIPTNSINYGGMFCSPTNNNTINVDVSSISNNYNLQQHYNNQIIQSKIN
ncbi:unnamed protein product [Meloidogyne enterolobii]|uniref:Uncharacterized protein n=1 Tax=Meloidogyne enterolobii TaxID=390850 RepID=A0ACB0YNQ9_MELEN